MIPRTQFLDGGGVTCLLSRDGYAVRPAERGITKGSGLDVSKATWMQATGRQHIFYIK